MKDKHTLSSDTTRPAPEPGYDADLKVKRVTLPSNGGNDTRGRRMSIPVSKLRTDFIDATEVHGFIIHAALAEAEYVEFVRNPERRNYFARIGRLRPGWEYTSAKIGVGNSPYYLLGRAAPSKIGSRIGPAWAKRPNVLIDFKVNDTGEARAFFRTFEEGAQPELKTEAAYYRRFMKWLADSAGPVAVWMDGVRVCPPNPAEAEKLAV